MLPKDFDKNYSRNIKGKFLADVRENGQMIHATRAVDRDARFLDP